MKIVVMLSGFIRNYEHLEEIKNGFEKLQQKEHDVYFIGVTYSILSPSKYHGGGKDGIGVKGIEKTLEDNVELVEHNIILPMSALEIVPPTEMIIYDKDGYDGRCLGQFFMIDKTVKLVKRFQEENGVHFDYGIRCRWDSRVSSKLDVILEENKNRIVFALHGDLTLPTDQFFMGPFEKMISYLSIFEKYYEYVSDEKFKKRTSPVSEKSNYGRFPSCPELLFRHHRDSLFADTEFVMIKNFASLQRN